MLVLQLDTVLSHPMGGANVSISFPFCLSAVVHSRSQTPVESTSTTQGDVDEYRCHFEVTVQWKQVPCLNNQKKNPCGSCENRGKINLCYRHVIFHQEKIQPKTPFWAQLGKTVISSDVKLQLIWVCTPYQTKFTMQKNKTQFWVCFRFWPKPDVKRSDLFQFISFALPMNN